MELEGSLKAFSLPEILQFLAMGKLTGTLMVRHDHHGIDLVIRQGRIVNSSTFDHSKRLGQMLVHRRLIYRSILEKLLHEQRTVYPDKMLGQLLVERELLSPEDLRAAIKAQLEEEIWELFSWESGEFRFEHASDDDIRDVSVEIDVEPLIIEGTRRVDEWKAIIRNLRGDSTVLGLNPWQPEERAELTLTAAEWQVLSFVNGRFSVASIAARAGIGKFETYRILNAFLGAGICHIIEDPFALPDEAQEIELDEVVQEEAPAAGRRLNFFGKRRASDVALSVGKGETFLSPLGLVARFVSITIQNCFSHRDFSFAAGDDQYLERSWFRVIMDYPMADVVRINGNEVDVSEAEHYLQYDADGTATRRMYEDVLEGLRSLYGTMSATFAQRMGEKAYQRATQTLQKDWVQQCQIENPRGFDFSEFLARSQPIAQGVM